MAFQIIINSIFIFKSGLARIHNFQSNHGSGKQNKHCTNFSEAPQHTLMNYVVNFFKKPIG